MGRRKWAWVALILSLWPLLLFTFLSGITVLFFLTVAFNAERFRVEVLEPFVILVFQTVRSPAITAPVLSALFGLAMGFGVMRWRGKEKATAMWAASFGVASLVMYVLLLSLWSGFGR